MITKARGTKNAKNICKILSFWCCEWPESSKTACVVCLESSLLMDVVES